MSFILYCIFPIFDPPNDFLVSGVGDHPVEVVTWGNLGIAISSIGPREITPEISRITAYEKVVETFFAYGPVIPLRYGNTVESKGDIPVFLERGHNQYERILRELRGCVEMGIRILLPARQAVETDAEMAKDILDTDSSGSGASYLSSRRVHYEMEDTRRKDMKETVDRFLKAFSGLFKKSKVEDPLSSPVSRLMMRTQGPILSLYFLVSKESMEEFYKRFRELDSKESDTILLSGPWPPYNFV